MSIFFPEKKKAKILIIDDELDICTYLKAKLVRTGKYDVYSSTDPYDGIEMAKSVHPDLVVLDIMMPGIDGTEVADRLSKDPDTKDIFIVFSSILVHKQDIHSADGKIGGWPFISKEMQPDEVVAQIENFVHQAHPAAG